MSVVLKLGTQVPRRLLRSHILGQLKTQTLVTRQATSTYSAYSYTLFQLRIKQYPLPREKLELLKSGYGAGQHYFSTSAIMCMPKQFDMKKLERCNIYDPNGNYIVSSEIYNVEKFCENFKKFSSTVMEGSNCTKAELGLQSVQIINKHGKDKTERAKLFKIKSTDAPWVIEKIKKMLLDHGTVDIVIQGKQTKPVRQLLDNEWIAKVCSISTVQEEDRKIFLKIMMPDSIESIHFKHIFTEFCAKDSNYLKQMKELFEETKEITK